MNEIQNFENTTLDVNIRVLDIDGEPWFIAKDVAKALGYRDTTQAVRKHCKGGVEITPPSRGGNQKTKIIPESDVYRLIMRSKKPEAEKFQDWVTGEVLPSIRKHGAFLTDDKVEAVLNDPEEVFRLAQALVDERDARKQLQEKEEIFGNRTKLGEISKETGCPRHRPVRGYLRSKKGEEQVCIAEIQLRLFK